MIWLNNPTNKLILHDTTQTMISILLLNLQYYYSTSIHYPIISNVIYIYIHNHCINDLFLISTVYYYQYLIPHNENPGEAINY